MKVVNSEVGFRYVSYKIEDSNNSYTVIKSMSPYSSMSIVDQDNKEVTDKDVIENIIQKINDYNQEKNT